jgi:UDP-N-acetylenolpyruvoylglucosamine reductase
LHLGVGGPARFFTDAHDEADVLAAWRWARARASRCESWAAARTWSSPTRVVDGLVVRIGLRGLSAVAVGSAVELTAGAGEPWDAVVRHAVERGWAGLECLSGIPGLTGATPIQNVGAYGQEVSDTITAVRALHRERGAVVTLTATDCAFAYRDSLLKSGAPDRYAVLAVTYRLEPDGRPRVRYADLEQHLAARGIATPSLADVRASILDIRRGKSMVLDPDDPNRRAAAPSFSIRSCRRRGRAHRGALRRSRPCRAGARPTGGSSSPPAGSSSARALRAGRGPVRWACRPATPWPSSATTEPGRATCSASRRGFATRWKSASASAWLPSRHSGRRAP